jgi:hypothetical protein
MIAWMKNPAPLSGTPVVTGNKSAKAPSEFDVRLILRKSIEFSLPKSGVYTFSILSLQGRLIERHTGYRTAGNNAIFSLKKPLTSGAYTVYLHNGSGMVLEKVVQTR